MTDPVIDNDGNSYERTAIEQWLTNHATSPVTRLPMRLQDLRPNRALKDSIDAMKAKGVDLTVKRAPLPPAPAPSSFQRPSQGDISITIKSNGDYALISLVPPKGAQRTPSDVVCVIDISGSMDADASLKDAKGVSENNGLTVLDIVKHAVKTIINSLDEHDRLGLVSFSDQARVELDLTVMNAAGRASATRAVENMHTEGSTNLWDGLYRGLEVLREHAVAGKNAAVLLLTDGEPNIVPPRGHLPMLKNYRDRNNGLPGAVMTFGFGYRLDSQLLLDLGVAGNGSYAFIPDSTLTGTVFVNALTRILSTCATNLVLTLEPESGSQITDILGGHSMTKAAGSTDLRFGSLLFGQARDIVVKMDFGYNASYLRAKLTYRDVVTGEAKQVSAVGDQVYVAASADEITEHRLRLEFVDTIRKVISLSNKGDEALARTLLSDLAQAFKASKLADSERGADLLLDLEGQATEAVSKSEFYSKWGKHYLPSLMEAHLDQACNNFKDPGVQHYASDLFRSIRDKLDDTFLKLPPPKPSKARPQPSSSSSRGSSSSSFSGFTYAPAPVSMSGYYNSAGPCFSGASRVLMADGQLVRCDQVKQGDLVATSNGSSAIRCVVETVSQNGSFDLCLLPTGLQVTAWHPIQHEGRWTFPCSLVEPKSFPCSSIFSFLLEGGASLTVEGVECVALAHGLTESKVVSHPFWGTQSVAENLSRLRGWAQGHVRLLQDQCVVRDPETGLVHKIVQHAESS